MLKTTLPPFPPLKVKKTYSFYREYGEDEGSLRKVTEALGLKVGDLVVRHNFVSSMTQKELEETAKKIHGVILQCAYESYYLRGEELFLNTNDRRHYDYSDSYRRINSFSRTPFSNLPQFLRSEIERLFHYQDGTYNLKHWMGMNFTTLSHYLDLNQKRLEKVIVTGNIVSDFSDYDKNIIDYFKFACRDLDIVPGVKLITDITLGRNVNIITYYNFGVIPQEHKCLILKEGTRASSASSFLCFSKVPESPSKNHEEEENPAEEE